MVVMLPTKTHASKPGRQLSYRLRLAWAIGALALVIAFFYGRGANLSEYTYGPEQLTQPELLNGLADGFYGPETDSLDNHYLWTKPQATIDFDFHTKKPLQLELVLRSASVANGPATPVKVVVNGQEVANLQPDAASLKFQTFQLEFTPAPTDPPRLQVQILAQKFRPADQRLLGTMVQRLSIKSEIWPSLRCKLDWLIGLLAGLGLILGWLITRARPSIVLIGLAGAAGSLTAMVAAYFFAEIGLWTGNNLFYLVSCTVIVYLGVLFWQTTSSLPLLSNGSNLYGWALHRVAGPMPAATTQVARPTRTLNALTGLRAIAALLVFFVHIPPVAPNVDGLGWLRNFMAAGTIGVPLFFTLSGFVICYNYYDRLASWPWPHLWPYLVARLARIYPMHLVVLLVSVALVGFNTRIRRDPFTLLQQLALLTPWSDNLPIRTAYRYNVPSWSLGVEFFLYLCFPVLAWAVLRHCNKTWQLLGLALLGWLFTLGAATIAALTVGLNQTDYESYRAAFFWLTIYPVTQLGFFVAGCAVARLYVRQADQPVSQTEGRRASLALGLSIMAIIFLMIYDRGVLTPFRLEAVYLPFFAIVIYCLARYRNGLSRLLSTRWAVVLGEASYSFYLIHFMVLNLTTGLTGDGTNFSNYVWGIVLLVSITGLALLAFFFVETPLRRLVRRIAAS